MKIIKLNAIDSTNSFLKEMSQKMPLKNFTVVAASSQEKGKGQMGNEWVSEPHKNLLCSVFVAFESLKITDQVLLNYAVSVGVSNALKEYKLPKLKVKWPNDILSSNQKLGGLLIENVMQKNMIVSTVIGIGLNVNQVKFPENLPNATSIKNQIKKEVVIDDLLENIIDELKSTIDVLISTNKNDLKDMYLNALYKKNIPTMFKDSEDALF
ncbi:MAG: biotin--[acetyl-CoA-carboxylase] ligase, partial [Flavobacteriaceae bacterium]|nr:biotin--[acetyl-CoA-carboxylase] ligase [Flavobacteriaceae bacterium]